MMPVMDSLYHSANVLNVNHDKFNYNDSDVCSWLFSWLNDLKLLLFIIIINFDYS